MHAYGFRNAWSITPHLQRRQRTPRATCFPIRPGNVFEILAVQEKFDRDQIRLQLLRKGEIIL